MGKIGFVLALLAVLISSSGMAADKERQVYAPTGQWAIEYADDACRLIRNFTDGENEMTLAFERFELGPATRLGLAGKTLAAWSAATVATFRYLPRGELRESPLLRGQLADGRGSFLISSASLISPERGRAIVKNWKGAASMAEFDEEDRAAASQTTAIIVSEGLKVEVEIRLGSMVEPIKALQACATDMVKSWGVDPQAVAGIVRPPQPVQKPETWMNSWEYPSDMLRRGKGGVVGLRLILSPEGIVEDCHFEVEEPGTFEMAACQAIKTRARFKPGLDAKGQPVRTYWRQNVRFAP